MPLTNENPSYASQSRNNPAVVCTPSSYTKGPSSSLVVAFEDPDGSRVKEPLAAKYLYAFGTRASV